MTEDNVPHSSRICYEAEISADDQRFEGMFRESDPPMGCDPYRECLTMA